MATNGSGFVPGLEGVVAFHTAIAEPDRDGGSLRYRGVDIEDLVGRVGFEDAWALLVDDAVRRRDCRSDTSPPAFRSGDVRVDVQASLPLLAPARGFGPLLDITDEQARDHLAQTTSAVLSYAAHSARGERPAVLGARTRVLFRRWCERFVTGLDAVRRTRSRSGRSTRTGCPRPSTA